jgi:hypothetical protein
MELKIGGDEVNRASAELLLALAIVRRDEKLRTTRSRRHCYLRAFRHR